jgi:hypothetical protein
MPTQWLPPKKPIKNSANKEMSAMMTLACQKQHYSQAATGSCGLKSKEVAMVLGENLTIAMEWW